jgi:crooked neck
LEAWLEFEKENGNEHDTNHVQQKLPKAVKKRRKLQDDQGNMLGWEEYFDYIFPEDDTESSNIKLLAMAHEWKMKMQQDSSSETESETEAE